MKFLDLFMTFIVLCGYLTMASASATNLRGPLDEEDYNPLFRSVGRHLKKNGNGGGGNKAPANKAPAATKPKTCPQGRQRCQGSCRNLGKCSWYEINPCVTTWSDRISASFIVSTFFLLLMVACVTCLKTGCELLHHYDFWLWLLIAPSTTLEANDKNNCGTCGNVCASGLNCKNNVCQ